ncbi:AAA family ATPase [Candidatus Saccharibacteria bacterium]|nr:AAA family ATPase [Candidatus Saccharibacteria bacterium]
MAINPAEKMVIVDGHIITPELAYCIFDEKKMLYFIRRKGADKYYKYSPRRVLVLDNPDRLNNTELKSLKDITNLKILAAWRFATGEHKYYHLFLEDRTQLDLDDSSLASHEVFTYLHNVANAISNEQNYLSQLYSKVGYSDIENSSLKYYLQQSKPSHTEDKHHQPLIFPFGCNESQYQAVYNAIHNNVSVIEGPPGTGKTQTILNIIANLVIRRKSCQIVSNNNSAIENVEDKLKEYGLDFFVAKLGSSFNKSDFIENQKEIPDLLKYQSTDIGQLESRIEELQGTIHEIYKDERELSEHNRQLQELSIEKKHFEDYLKTEHIKPTQLKRKGNPYKVWLDLQNKENISFWQKVKYVLFYGVGSFAFYSKPKKEIITSLQSAAYDKKISELNSQCSILSKKIKSGEKSKKDFTECSMAYFRKWLSDRYGSHEREHYELNQIHRSFYAFIQDYPVILSTTYSARSSFSLRAKFDYVIMDEASQIDTVTGALALSSGENAVIVGDERQLPNVVTEKEKRVVDNIFENYRISDGYSFSKNSFLSSIKAIIPEAPVCLLREHYRCQPKIIGFCNKQFYDSQLIIMTKESNSPDTIKVIRTNIGNHARDHVNQRQIDIIKTILPKLQSKDVGIITPYRNQVTEIRKSIPGIEVDTIHKFQGREKDVIIISTVDNEISDFVDDPHILNVAISRAKKQLIMIATGNKIYNTTINDFIEYANYYNFETGKSPIYSIFDYLYSQYTNQRMALLAQNHKVSEYDSENLMYSLIDKEIKHYDNLGVIVHQPLYMLLRDKTIMTDEEQHYALNPLTHLDFLIYNRITKQPLLAIEVDGYAFHKQGTEQSRRDLKKDAILKKYNIPIIRFSTTGSQEKERLHVKLNEILNGAHNEPIH